MTDRRPARVRLFHWDAEAAVERVSTLERLGFVVVYDFTFSPEILKQLRADPPDAAVIDLSRAPSQGRDIGVALRTARSTRLVPLVFVDGAEEKVARTREVLPDATYTSWGQVYEALPKAIEAGSSDPVVPRSALAGYSGTPLPKKLGIKENTRLALLAAPVDARRILGTLPSGVTFLSELSGETDLAIWFVRSLADLKTGVAKVAEELGDAHLWIAWPKKTSALATDVGQQDVRDAGLSHSLVDYKVCAIDATWSGLKFVSRKRSD